MRSRDDVMERLAAADPLRDTAQLKPGEQHDADALLARLLATPADEDADRRTAEPPRKRRWALVTAGALCSVAAAFAAVNLLDSDSRGRGVVEKAVAAVSQGGSVYHVLERMHARPLGLRGTKGGKFYFESWHTTGGRAHRKSFEPSGGHRGRLVEEWAGRRLPGRRGGPFLRWDVYTNTISPGGFAIGRGTKGAPALDPFGDPGVQLRALEQEGRLRLAGTTKVGDRTAYRLVSGTVPGMTKRETQSVVFFVDSETYLPLAQRNSIRHTSGRGFDFVIRYLVYERLPLNARTRKELDLDPHPGAKCSPSNDLLKGRRAQIGFPNPCKR